MKLVMQQIYIVCFKGLIQKYTHLRKTKIQWARALKPMIKKLRVYNRPIRKGLLG